jgi:acyl carrier protein
MDTAWKLATLAKIQSIFRDHFLDDGLVVGETTSPEDIEEWDSLAHVNLLAAVEQAFGVRFTADEMGNIDGVATLLAALDRKRAGSA